VFFESACNKTFQGQRLQTLEHRHRSKPGEASQPRFSILLSYIDAFLASVLQRLQASALLRW